MGLRHLLSCVLISLAERERESKCKPDLSAPVTAACRFRTCLVWTAIYIFEATVGKVAVERVF